MIGLESETDSQLTSTGPFMSATPTLHNDSAAAPGTEGGEPMALAQPTPAFSPLYQQIKVLIWP